jgi:hypothetical protein
MSMLIFINHKLRIWFVVLGFKILEEIQIDRKCGSWKQLLSLEIWNMRTKGLLQILVCHLKIIEMELHFSLQNYN